MNFNHITYWVNAREVGRGGKLRKVMKVVMFLMIEGEILIFF